MHQSIRDAGLRLDCQAAFSQRTASHHSIASHCILRRCGFHDSVAVVLGAHHGKPPDDGQLTRIRAFAKNIGFDNEIWLSLQEELLDYALALADITKSFAQSVKLKKPAQVLLSGLVILVDWIASDDNLFPLLELHENRADSKERALLAETLLNLTPTWSTDRDWNQLYKRRFNIDQPRPVQKDALGIAQHCLKPGIIVVEAPMGEGKTEAALVAAEIMAGRTGRGGIYFALPTQATSDAMLMRVCRWIDVLTNTEAPTAFCWLMERLTSTQATGKSSYQNVHVGDGDGDADDGIVVHEWLSGRKSQFCLTSS